MTKSTLGKSASVADEYKLAEGKTFTNNAEDFDKWDSKQLAEFLGSCGLMAYKKMVLDHKITGKFAHLLTDDDLKDMGMIVVGDRLRFKQLMVTMGRKARFCSSTKAVWTGEERYYYGDMEREIFTCAGFCPEGKLVLLWLKQRYL